MDPETINAMWWELRESLTSLNRYVSRREIEDEVARILDEEQEVPEPRPRPRRNR